MSRVNLSDSFNSAASSTDSYLNLDLTPATSFEYNGPIIGFLADNDCGSLIFCDDVSQNIYAELVDNMQNATLSPNALEFRCKVFGSIFGREVAGPKGRRKSLNAMEEDHAYIRGSDDEDTPRPVLAEVPKVKKSAVKRKVGPVPPRTLPGLTKTKPVVARKVGDGVQKRRNTGRGMIPKRSYIWKDPAKNKKKLYGKLALEAGVTIDEYLAVNNISAEASTHNNNSARSSVNHELSEEEEMDIMSDDSTESGDDFHDEEQADGMDQDDQDELFVDQCDSRAHQPSMTDRRIAMLASQNFHDLSKLTDAEPVNDVSIAVKSALQKIKAGSSSQLTAVEQVELRLAVQRYETTF